MGNPLISAADAPEEWRPVVRWLGLYDISSLGSARSLPRMTRSGVRGGQILKPSPTASTGYLAVTLHDGPRIERRSIHVLVLEAFHGPCPEGMVGCHGPGGPLDNRASVLYWDTQANNTGRDKVRDGTLAQGERHGMVKLTDEQVMEIRRRYAAGESVLLASARTT